MKFRNFNSNKKKNKFFKVILKSVKFQKNGKFLPTGKSSVALPETEINSRFWIVKVLHPICEGRPGKDPQTQLKRDSLG